MRAQRLIGRLEIIRHQVSRRRAKLFFNAQVTAITNDHHVTVDAVMASETEQLPHLTGFLKIALRPEWHRRMRFKLGAAGRADSTLGTRRRRDFVPNNV